jgi:alcohol dehydrogenase, propanol-preferring
MRAMLLERTGAIHPGSEPLRFASLPDPEPAENEVLIQVLVCGVCHTELDEIEGRTPPPRLPVIPGHQVVGRVLAAGSAVRSIPEGLRVGVAWIGGACGACEFCTSSQENLCPGFVATGRDRHGGYADLMTARAEFVFPIPEALGDAQAAPMLCAGAIGYRSLRLTQLRDGEQIGLTGFGASARLVLQLLKHQFPRSRVTVFARSESERAAALKLGADWAGDTCDAPPALLDAIIDTTPAWTPIVAGLANLKPGGRLVVNAIRKEAADQATLSTLSYERHLWLEKEIKSVANVTRQDVAEFLRIAAEMNVQSDIDEYELKDANSAIVDLRTKPVTAVKVLRITH